MESRNFIPLGSVGQRLPFDQSEPTSKSTDDSSIAKEERKRARREKRKIKSDAAEQILNKNKKRKRSKTESEDGAVDKQSSEKPHKKKIDSDAVELVVSKTKQRKRPKVESEDGAVDKQSSEKPHKKKKIKSDAAELVVNKIKKRKQPKAESEDGAVDKQSSEKTHKKKKTKVESTAIISTGDERDHVSDANARPKKSHSKKSKIEVEKPALAPTESSTAAEQWNPDALTGGEARKAKFLRLLGAGKSNGPTAASKPKPHTGTAAITKVQSELERQYEAGMKLKHDGGSKRRGIGA